ncbi:MAG: hypothetical protein IKS41_06755 [Alphaproteobacteria bacterium]|nr:hypothetical protein [Alphaproteobacteria bacterium]
MAITRRGFLGLLVSAGVMAAEARPAPAPKTAASPAPQQKPLSSGSLLIDSYLPILKVNEGKSLHFYHKKGDKVTVGYGTNVESNPGYLSGVPIFCNGKVLTPVERRTFLATMAAKTKDDLAKYSIRASDAQKMAIMGMRDAILSLVSTFATPRDKNFFHNLPLCMQALCVDVFYNVGRGNFEKFPKFQSAIRRKDFDEAVKESVVYVDKETRQTNKKREWMKKRLLAVMRVVQANPAVKTDALTQIIEQDYIRNTPLTTRVLGRSNLEGELSMARGEWAHLHRSTAEKTIAPAQKPKVPSLKDKAVFHPGTASVRKPVAKTQSPARPRPRGFLKDKAVSRYGVVRGGSEK